jgi:riboflavin transporter FmnP
LGLDSKKITAIVCFSALAIALNTVRLPTIFWPGQSWHVWEIPVIVAFLLFGFKVGFSVAVINAAGQMMFFFGSAGVLGPFWSMIVILDMFFGIYLAKKLSSLWSGKNRTFLGLKPVAHFTLIGTLTRVSIMPFVDYTLYLTLLPLAIGINIPQAYVIGLLPFIVLFNILTPLYTVPLSYMLAKTVNKNLKLGKELA